MENNELKHYGVLGMRWGKRKARYDSDGSDSDSKPDEVEKRRSRNKKIISAAIATVAAVGIGVAIYGKKKRGSAKNERTVFESGKRITSNVVKQIANRPYTTSDGWEVHF